MTGCYKFVGRDCVPPNGRAASGDCVHCGCPISERSTYKPDMVDQHSAQLRVARRLKYARGVVHESQRTEKSVQVEAGLKRKSRVKEALKETREELGK